VHSFWIWVFVRLVYLLVWKKLVLVGMHARSIIGRKQTIPVQV